MLLVIANRALADVCEDPATGVLALGAVAYESLSLVLDVLSPPTVDLRSLAGLRSLTVQIDATGPPRVVITTQHVRITFIPLSGRSKGELAMALDYETSLTASALQIEQVVAFDGAKTSRTFPVASRLTPKP